MGFCARCAGTLVGALGTSFYYLSLGKDPTGWITILLPLPAFADWGICALSGKNTSKHVNLVTGVLLGAAVPLYFFGLLRVGPLFVFSAVAYLFTAGLIFAARRKS